MMQRWPAIAALVAGLLCSPALAQSTGKSASPETTVIAGGYELATADGARRCIVLLRPAAAAGGNAIGFPAQCRMALPIMASVAAWTVEPLKEAPHARIRFHNAVGAVMLDFAAPSENDSAMARDVTSAAYTLKPNAGGTLAQRMASIEPKKAPPPTTGALAAAARPVDPNAMQKAAGTYALLRDKGRSTGCILTLAATAGRGSANLAPGCADAGLNTFAPVGWHLTDGTLWLVGGKGQRLSFEQNRRSGWEKGPGQGAGLTLMREGN